jgi:rhodanese-related sulfurtransferase
MLKSFVTSMVLAAAPLTLTQAPLALASEAVAPELSLDEVKKLVETKGATFLDANSEVTYDKGHIPGAINFSRSSKKLAEVLPKDKNATIVAYCGGPMCSAWEDAAKAAKSLGYANVKHFKGGIKVWQDAGQKVEKGS